MENGGGHEGGVVGVKGWGSGGLGVVEVYGGDLEGGLGVVESRGGGDHRVVEVKGCGRSRGGGVQGMVGFKRWW